jgi:branched-chain amino acid transport system permease protein
MLGLFEAFIQFALGVRFAFASMLLVVIMVLVWRPYGLFGRTKVTKL